MVRIKFLLIRIITEKSHISRNPYLVITFEDVGNIMILQLFEQGRYLLAHQFVAPFYQPIETTVDTYPRFTVAIDITDGHVKHTPIMGVGADLIDIAIVFEFNQTYLLIINNPNPA